MSSFPLNIFPFAASSSFCHFNKMAIRSIVLHWNEWINEWHSNVLLHVFYLCFFVCSLTDSREKAISKEAQITKRQFTTMDCCFNFESFVFFFFFVLLSDFSGEIVRFGRKRPKVRRTWLLFQKFPKASKDVDDHLLDLFGKCSLDEVDMKDRSVGTNQFTWSSSSSSSWCSSKKCLTI